VGAKIIRNEAGVCEKYQKRVANEQRGRRTQKGKTRRAEKSENKTEKRGKAETIGFDPMQALQPTGTSRAPIGAVIDSILLRHFM
jgi:hypothetical protein